MNVFGLFYLQQMHSWQNVNLNGDIYFYVAVNLLINGHFYIYIFWNFLFENVLTSYLCCWYSHNANIRAGRAGHLLLDNRISVYMLHNGSFSDVFMIILLRECMYMEFFLGGDVNSCRIGFSDASDCSIYLTLSTLGVARFVHKIYSSPYL